jgi:hypothetical protein
VMELHSGYDMVIMAVNNERARPEEYLQLFLDPKKRIVSVPLEDLERSMSQSGEVKAAELNRELLKRAVVLPLFQPVRTFYYPKYVKSVQFGASFYEYPEIAAAE